MNGAITALCCAGVLVIAMCAAHEQEPTTAAILADFGQEKKPVFRAGAVRYQVRNVERSVAFYTQNLGFKLDQQAGPAFARVSNGTLILWLSGPGSSGSRPMPDGRKQEPGGWNRLVLEVEDLPSRVSAMKKAGLRFRNEIETGPGGKQIQLEDPDGNPIEIFQPAGESSTRR